MGIAERLLPIAVCGSLVIGLAAPADAAFLGDFNVTLDLSTVQDGAGNGFPFSGSFSVSPQIPIAPFTAKTGDSFGIHLDFYGDQSLKYVDTNGDDREWFTIDLGTSGNPDTGFDTRVKTVFNDVSGDLIVLPWTITTLGAPDGYLPVARGFNLTDTEFSFGGVSLFVEVVDDRGPVTFNSFDRFSEYGSGSDPETQRFEISTFAVAAVEPAALALFGFGAAALLAFASPGARRRVSAA